MKNRNSLAFTFHLISAFFFSMLTFNACAKEGADIGKLTIEGKTLYKQHCTACHGVNGQGGQFAPALTGETFLDKWAGQSAYQVLRYIWYRMPPGEPGKLSPAESIQVLNYLLAESGLLTNDKKIPTNRLEMGSIVFPLPPGGVSPQKTIEVPPPPNPDPNPLDHIAPSPMLCWLSPPTMIG